MKIALLTIWHEKNYGAELQAYATIKLLQGLGHNVQMIDLRLSDRNSKSVKNVLANAIESVSPCSHKFGKFWKKHIPTTRRYHSLTELKNNPPDADIYIVGSDQVWNPHITTDFWKIFFLPFGKESIKRISIASSFGQDSFDFPSKVEEISVLLSKFDLITCREQSGVQILKDVFKKQSHLVLDPTLLLQSYDNLIDPKSINQKNTLVYYPLSNDNELTNLACDISNDTGMETININEHKTLLKKIVWNRPSIDEWLRDMAEAKFIITRSFHGVAFSLIFNKNFAVLKTRNNRLTRITNLLKLVGLENRLYDNVSDLKTSKPWENSINYAEINSTIQQLRADSIKLIKNSLQFN